MPASRPTPDPHAAPAPAEPDAPSAPMLRSHRRPRPAQAVDAPQGSEVHELQDRIAQAFRSPLRLQLETALIKLLIVAATCVVLRSAIVNGGELLVRSLR